MGFRLSLWDIQPSGIGEQDVQFLRTHPVEWAFKKTTLLIIFVVPFFSEESLQDENLTWKGGETTPLVTIGVIQVEDLL